MSRAPVPVAHADRVAVTSTPQWLHCAHHRTALDIEAGEITLAEHPVDPPVVSGATATPAGLAVDEAWRVYHAVPEEGRIERMRWSPRNLRRPVTDTEDLLRPPAPPRHGGFTATAATGAVAAAALAVDGSGRLLVLDTGDSPVLLVYELDTRRLLRRITLPVPPVDIAVGPSGAVVAASDRERPVWLVDPRRAPRALTLPGGALAGVPADALPSRVAADPAGRVWLLWRDGSGAGWATPIEDPRRSGPLEPFPSAGDIELDGTGALVVAGPPGAVLRRIVLDDDADAEARPLRAGGYDGRGLTRAPDGRIAYWAGRRPRVAYAEAARYHARGHVTTFALDSGEFRRQWGRVFVDACVPAGAAITVEAITADELPDTAMAWSPPDNVRPDRAPQPPPGPSLPDAAAALRLGPGYPLHRRDRPELPWLANADPLHTFEAPLDAAPGRYLWLRITLHGTRTASPRIRALRVQTRAHDLLRRLPRVFSDEPRAASFLHRYLGMIDALLSDMDQRAALRDLAFSPTAAAPELLGWLAALVGLTLDQRWPLPARRTLLAEAVPLLRRRGTVGSLHRMLHIYLGSEPVLVERFRFRGLEADPADGPAVLGGGFRVGGTLGTRESAPPPAPGPPPPSGGDFDQHAHRFSVIVRRPLSAEQRATVEHLLEMHRPAHTVVDICTVDSGMRVGVGLHLGLTTVVGPGAGFRPLQLGATAIGRDTVLGHPAGGIRVASSRLGTDSRVGS